MSYASLFVGREKRKYIPALPNIPQVISINLNILRSSQRCLEAFSSPSCVLHRFAKTMWHTGQGQTLQASPTASGAFRCHRNRCKTHPFITEGTTSYTFFSTKEQRRIRHHITCCSHLYVCQKLSKRVLL